MLIIYFLSAVVISAVIFCFRNRTTHLLCVLLFLVSQTTLTVYALCHVNERDSLYFTFDSLGVVLSIVLALLSYATFYHSYIYLKERSDTKRNKRIY